MATKATMIRWVCRLLLGGFFLVAGLMKGLDPAAFQQDILAYQLVDTKVAYLLASFLPFFELAIAFGILSGVASRTALLLAVSALVAFIIALAWTWARGIDIDCGCLGPIDWVSGQPSAIARDLVLIALAAGLWKYEVRQVKPKNHHHE